MKYNPKKLTYGDALGIATANMTVTVEDENGQHVTGKLKHLGPNDALAGDNLELRVLITLASPPPATSISSSVTTMGESYARPSDSIMT